MLDPWIIEQIRKREEDERRHREQRPEIEIPEYPPMPPRGRDGYRDDYSGGYGDEGEQPGGERGVVIIDL
ncbi:MAG: hypothetical protein KA244_11695 [Deltaproteobacteria bacterium]|jgi:hypothetical protein|nr:hypothetical protein [Deltaproteobacteria bacterium]